MQDGHADTLVLQDGAGAYFLVSRATLEEGRVPEERKAEVERLIAAADVAGYTIPQTVNYVVKAIAFGAELVGEGLAKAYFEGAYGPHSRV